MNSTMPTANAREVWLRGPVEGVPPLLQPVAHALLQAREEIHTLVEGFPEAALWDKPAGMASAGLHLQHLTGVLDRLFTYARGESLTTDQLNALAGEGKQPPGSCLIHDLVTAFDRQVALAISQLSITGENDLTVPREVGRAKIPSTVIGLLFHAAEHTMRHLGQLLVTVNIVRHSGK